VAVVPQTPVVPDGVTVFDYVMLGRTPYIPYWGIEGPSDRERVTTVLARLDLEEFAGRPVSSLSGGERQRAVLARALAQDASILLLDEPTTALDLGHQQQVLELVDGLRHEVGLVVISTMHDLTFAAQFGDRVLLLVGGKVVAEGLPERVLQADVVAKHFGATVEVIEGRDGPVVLPVRR
jgi:iron complex transport system ATP-binding protein